MQNYDFKKPTLSRSKMSQLASELSEEQISSLCSLLFQGVYATFSVTNSKIFHWERMML